MTQPTTRPSNEQVIASPIRLPDQFVRFWQTPASWAGKPEVAHVRDGRITIINEAGENTVCKDELLQPQPDGSLVLTWSYGPGKSGYEVWSLRDGRITISRWNSKAEYDDKIPPRRVGSVKD